jgi:hypothetical protein
MQNKIEALIHKTLKATEIKELETIQSLWSGYGKIIRLGIKGVPAFNSAILKHIILPQEQEHPRGWNTNLSHQRKLKSYLIEMNWYALYAEQCNDDCRVAKCYHSEIIGEEQLILLEDLDASGFPIRKSDLNINEVKVCLKWLANFHATFLNVTPKELWEVGTYWNLSTRPEELAAMKNTVLKEAAIQLDELLNNCEFKTIVHGDAKVANFCFSEDGNKVAAVDFQYVGGGCGIKDVVYLLGSCLREEDCELFDKVLLSYYFNELKKAIIKQEKTFNFTALEKEWRYLFPIAWTDFNRFLDGWMPTHQKLNGYSENLEKEVLKKINN